MQRTRFHIQCSPCPALAAALKGPQGALRGPDPVQDLRTRVKWNESDGTIRQLRDLGIIVECAAAALNLQSPQNRRFIQCQVQDRVTIGGPTKVAAPYRQPPHRFADAVSDPTCDSAVGRGAVYEQLWSCRRALSSDHEIDLWIQRIGRHFPGGRF